MANGSIRKNDIRTDARRFEKPGFLLRSLVAKPTIFQRNPVAFA